MVYIPPGPLGSVPPIRAPDPGGQALSAFRLSVCRPGLRTLSHSSRLGQTFTMDTAPSKQEIKECFTLFDRSGEGRIPAAELGMCLRSLKCKPTNSEVNKIAQSVIGGKSAFSVSDLERCVEMAFNLPGKSVEHLNDALKVFDSESAGIINIDSLRHVLCNLGERLSDREMEELLQICNGESMSVDDLTNRMTGGQLT